MASVRFCEQTVHDGLGEQRNWCRCSVDPWVPALACSQQQLVYLAHGELLGANRREEGIVGGICKRRGSHFNGSQLGRLQMHSPPGMHAMQALPRGHAPQHLHRRLPHSDQLGKRSPRRVRVMPQVCTAGAHLVRRVARAGCKGSSGKAATAAAAQAGANAAVAAGGSSAPLPTKAAAHPGCLVVRLEHRVVEKILHLSVAGHLLLAHLLADAASGGQATSALFQPQAHGGRGTSRGRALPTTALCSAYPSISTAAADVVAAQPL